MYHSSSRFLFPSSTRFPPYKYTLAGTHPPTIFSLRRSAISSFYFHPSPPRDKPRSLFFYSFRELFSLLSFFSLSLPPSCSFFTFLFNSSRNSATLSSSLSLFLSFSCFLSRLFFSLSLSLTHPSLSQFPSEQHGTEDTHSVLSFSPTLPAPPHASTSFRRGRKGMTRRTGLSNPHPRNDKTPVEG